MISASVSDCIDELLRLLQDAADHQPPSMWGRSSVSMKLHLGAPSELME